MTTSPVPSKERVVDDKGFVSRIWERFFQGLQVSGGVTNVYNTIEGDTNITNVTEEQSVSQPSTTEILRRLSQLEKRVEMMGRDPGIDSVKKDLNELKKLLAMEV